MAEHIILFAGPMGAGKTTAIRSLSEIEVVSTEAANTDRETADKDTTTVALDYGEITIGDEDKVRLYGIPGQRRFDFMWSVLKERAMGLVLLLNADAAAPLAQLTEFLEEFGDLHRTGGVVVGITRTDVTAGPSLADYARTIEAALPGSLVPVFTVDARSGAHMRTCLLSLIANIEMRSLSGALTGQVA
ncbi:ATP/GTP-binding protein [Novosphingobium flavum]|uniref:ATP/GTP-binding protein n=1 Tax=Novosphingobium flavum TaxID=1778672 RepID=A0A7X1FS92_9SPHN|nr:ATP/GTP-binding protein [Novosphingobium flavum]MBC2666008.1 ATP/GTP-binding protein [Novosphingobium flavum]